MTKLKMWPILVGILIDTLGSIGVGVLYFVGIFALQIARGAPASDEPFGTPHLIVTEIVGLFLTTVGGFVAARIARAQHVQHGIAVGARRLSTSLAICRNRLGRAAVLVHNRSAVAGAVHYAAANAHHS